MVDMTITYQADSNMILHSLHKKLVRQVAIIFVISLFFSSHAIASIFVLGRKYYLVGNGAGYVETGPEAATLRAKQLCVGGVVNCSGAYTTDFFDDGYNMWRWKGLWTYQTVYRNPPNEPVYTTYQEVISGPSSMNVRRDFQCIPIKPCPVFAWRLMYQFLRPTT